jgi:4-hydroxyproline epimerase
MQKISIIDSHTAGEPTRTIIGGFPALGTGSLVERLERCRSEFDHLRSGIINEPRGFPAIVGALLCEAEHEKSDAGVIFFNNNGYLGMCGHGTIGVIKTLEYLGRLDSKFLRLDTVAGTVSARLNNDSSVSVQNVASYRYKKDVVVDVPQYGQVVGDIAWGGNWFYLINEQRLEISIANLKNLTQFTTAVMLTLAEREITGKSNEKIDHVELFAATANADSKNFVLCPGGEYDRSPCGTGTSAKLACLADDELLKEGEIWKQESITGSVFEGSYVSRANEIIPTITGSASITAESTLVFEESDPFRYGIR